MGRGYFLELRSSFFDTSIEGHFYRNQLVNSPLEFDEEFIQILPQINFSTIPLRLWNLPSSFLKNVNIGLNSDLKVFKQNQFKEVKYIEMLAFEQRPLY